MKRKKKKNKTLSKETENWVIKKVERQPSKWEVTQAFEKADDRARVTIGIEQHWAPAWDNIKAEGTRSGILEEDGEMGNDDLHCLVKDYGECG